MKFFLDLFLYLVLAVMVFQTQAEDAIAEGAAAEHAVAEDPVAKGAAAEGAVVEGAAAEDAAVEGAVAKDAIAAKLVDEGATIDCVYQKPDCFCPQHEDPVCSVNGCTYGNDCKRICADAEFAYEGACHEDDLDVVE